MLEMPMLLPILKTSAETQSRAGSPRIVRTIHPLLCLAAMLACALPGLAASNTSGSTHRSSPSSFGKLLSPTTTHTGSYSKSGLPRSTPKSAGPVAKPVRSGQERQLDQMMKQDVSLMGKASLDRGSSSGGSSAKSYKPLASQGSAQGSGINFSARSSQSGHAKRH